MKWCARAKRGGVRKDGFSGRENGWVAVRLLLWLCRFLPSLRCFNSLDQYPLFFSPDLRFP